MPENVVQMLAELEDRFTLGEILESDYRTLKWQLIRKLKDQNILLDGIGGSIRREDILDSRDKTFCYVDPSPFIFGDDDRFGEVRAAYYIAKYEVTVEEFETFLDDTGYDFAEADRERLNMVSPYPTCPVSHVSYLDAKEYCRWLRKVTCEYYSLPHELEWEKAARGVDGRLCPWGNAAPTENMACFQGDLSYGHTVPVNSFPANKSPYGCMDMVGNVWEWCLDSFDDPRDPHILRGGAWCNSLDYCNCQSRTFSFPPEKRLDMAGIRLVYLPHDMLIDYRRQYQGAAQASSLSKLRVVKSKKTEEPAVAAVPGPGPGPERVAAASSGELSLALAEAVTRAAETVTDGSDAGSDTEVFKGRPQKDETPVPTMAKAPSPTPAVKPVGAVGETIESDEPLTDEDLQMYEQMAQAISDASKQYLSSQAAPVPAMDQDGDEGEDEHHRPSLKRSLTGRGGKGAVRGETKLEFVEPNDPEFEDSVAAVAGDEEAVPMADLDGLEREERARRELRKQRLQQTPVLAWTAFSLWCAMLLAAIGVVIWHIAGM